MRGVNRRIRAQLRALAGRNTKDVLLVVALGGLGAVIAVVCYLLIAYTSHSRRDGVEITVHSSAKDALLFVMGASMLFVAGALRKLALTAGRELAKVKVIIQNTPLSMTRLADASLWDVTPGHTESKSITNEHGRMQISGGNMRRENDRGEPNTTCRVTPPPQKTNEVAGYEAQAASVTRDDRRSGYVVVHDTQLPCSCVSCVSAYDYVVSWNREVVGKLP